MTPVFIQLTQTVTGAVITVIALLLVAVIIGYFTAWFYSKSVYTPVIKGLESEKTELNKELANFKDDVNKLNGNVEKLNDKISKLELESAEKDKEVQKLSKSK